MKKKNIKLAFSIIFVILLAIGIYWFLYQLINGPKINTSMVGSYNLNVDILPEPKQKLITESKFTHKFRGTDFTITKLATYDIIGRVVENNFYNEGVMSKIAPRDITLAWGELALNKNVKHIKFSNSFREDRTVKLITSSELYENFSNDEVISSISNNHVIASTEEIRQEILKTEIGNIVRIKGYLVYVESDQGDWGPSSLVRDDVGDDSCEIIYATEYVINP